MPIATGDVLIKYSVTSGPSGNSTVGTAAGSQGRYISKTTITDNVLNNLFDDITGIENQGLQNDYKCIFVHNNHASLTWQNVVTWISGIGSGTTIAIALDQSGSTLLTSATAQAGEDSDTDHPPSNTGAFSSPATSGAGLSLGNLVAGNVYPIWIKRTTINGAAMNNDFVTLALAGDTGA